jgi:hypothetical protein
MVAHFGNRRHFAALSGNHLLNDRTFDVLGEPVAGDAAIVIDAWVWPYFT